MSRVERARRNVRFARYAIAVTAGAALAVFVAAARNAHPATHHAAQTSAASATQDDSDSGGFFGESSISPSYGSTPQVRSAAS